MNPFNQKMSEKLGGFPIGVWVPYYRSDFSVDYLKEIRSCGVNFVPSISSGEEERKAIAAAGLKVLLNDDRVTYCNVTGIGRLKEWLSEYTQDENVIGIFVWDEPSPAMMRICGAINETAQSICPETFGFINLHPEYSDREKQRDGKTYEEYLDFFVKTCAPKVICYDNYPFYKDGFHADSFFSNRRLRPKKRTSFLGVYSERVFRRKRKTFCRADAFSGVCDACLRRAGDFVFHL